MLDDVAGDLAQWIDQTAESVALAFAPARSPFSARITEEQKLQFYRSRLFNPDGSPNLQGRSEEVARLGPEGLGRVYKAVVQHWPELKPPEAPPLEVPAQWPQPGPMSGPPGPGGLVPPGPPPGMPGMPGPAGPGPIGTPQLAMMPGR